MGKIYTFQFTFEHEEDQREDEIQFCAHNLAEADGLFYFWAKHDQYEDITWIRFEVVYKGVFLFLSAFVYITNII